MVRRSFVDLADGQVHVRMAGPVGERDPPPLVMLHASPGSSRQLEPLIRALSPGRRVVAPDTRGNGDSTPLPLPAPEIADFARATIEVLDALGLDRVDLYGSHTGASIAVDVARQAPGRVRRIVLDGMGLYSAADQADMLQRYAPTMSPDLEGRHLLWAFMFCRDQYLFWPWYRRGGGDRRPTGLPSADELHAFVLEVLKAIGTYHHSYRAAFRYPKREHLARLAHPALAITARDDMLFPYLEEIGQLLPAGTAKALESMDTAEGVDEAAAAIGAFLDE